MRRINLYPFFIVCLLGACQPKLPAFHEMQTAFAAPEFIPSGDGWAEARRRRLLKKFLAAKNVRVSEEQDFLRPDNTRNKYRKVILNVQSTESGAKKRSQFRVSLSLTPPWPLNDLPGFTARQKRCDAVFFETLANLEKYLAQYERVSFTVTDGCLNDGLTGRLTERK